MGFVYFNGFKDMSLKNMLSTRLYYSSVMDSFANEIIQDEPYTILQSFQNIGGSGDGSHLHNYHSLNAPYMILLCSIGILSILYKYRQMEDNHKLKRLDHFIEYYDVRKKINILLTIMSILFIKNVDNAF